MNVETLIRDGVWSESVEPPGLSKEDFLAGNGPREARLVARRVAPSEEWPTVSLAEVIGWFEGSR